STVATRVPSRNTCAIPPKSPLNPIQLTPVPLKASVVVAFASLDSAPVPPLKRESDGKIHVPVKVTDGLVSSTRVTGGGDPFDTVTLTGDEVVRFPAASLATAVRVCEPLPTVVVFQETEYGEAVSSAPRLAPSTRNCTPATPILSEAEALTVTVPDTVAPDAGALMLTEGGVVSGGGGDEPPLVTSKASARRQ